MVPFTVNRVKKITPRNPNEMKEALFHNGPVAVAVNNNWWDYKSGILPHNFCTKNVDHAVVVVGYGEEDGKKFWTIRNSWGPDWGENGYIRLQRSNQNNAGTCGVLKHPMYVSVTTNPDCRNECVDGTNNCDVNADCRDT